MRWHHPLFLIPLSYICSTALHASSSPHTFLPAVAAHSDPVGAVEHSILFARLAPTIDESIDLGLDDSVDHTPIKQVQALSLHISVLAQEAETLADLDAVRYYAQILLDHHAKIRVSLADFLAKIPGAPTTDSNLDGPVIDPDLRSAVRLLLSLRSRGREFDRAFLGFMVADHISLLRLLEDARGKLTDAALRTFFDDLLLTTKYHHGLARSLSRDEILEPEVR